MDELHTHICTLLLDIQENLYRRAEQVRSVKTFLANTWDEFLDVVNVKEGFAMAHWDGSAETETKIKALSKASIRCIPLDQIQEEGVCVFSGKPSKGRVVFSKAY